MQEQNFISAIVYIHNDSLHVGRFLTGMLQALRNHFENFEIVCVNDASADNSVKIIKELYRKENLSGSGQLTIVNLSYFHGLEKAMNAGIDLAIGDYCLEFDSVIVDYEMSLVMELYYKALEGYDYVGAVPNQRHLTSELFYKVFDFFSDQPHHMSSERFRITSRRMQNKVSMMNKSVPYRKAVYSLSGLSSCSIEYKVAANYKKDDKKEKNVRRNLGVDVLFLFTSMGYRFSTALTVLMGLTSLFMLAYALFVYLTSRPVEGWTPTILFLSFSFFGLFAGLTIVIKYLQLLVNLVFRRNEYSVLNIEKISRDIESND